MGCSECLLRGQRPVKFAGTLSTQVVLLFDCPSFNQERLELPNVLKKEGVENVFIASACRCHINKEKFTQGQINSILDCCRENLDVVFNEIKPKLVICFGKTAFQVHKKSTLKNARNQFFWNDEYNCWFTATYNPYIVSKDPSKLPYIQSDLINIGRFIDNGYKASNEITWKEVDSIRPILDGDCYKEGEFYLTSIDTETSSLQWYDENSVTISYQVSKNKTEGWTVVLHEEVGKGCGDFNVRVARGGTKAKPEYVEIGVKKAENYEQRVAELQELLIREDFKKYFFNQKFEQHRFLNLGITEWNNCVMDARVGAHVYDSEVYRDCSLDDLIAQFSDISSHKGDVTGVEKADMFTLLKTDRDKFVKYASLDPVLTLIVSLEIKKELLKDEKSLNYFVKFAQPIENDFLFSMERNGIKIDTSKIPEIKEELEKEKVKLALQFEKQCPPKVYERHKDNFKLTRTKIIQEALFEWKDTKLKKGQTEGELHNYGFNLEPVVVNQKSGTPSTDKKKVLKVLLEGKCPKKAKALIQTFIDWGERDKLLNNFIKNIEKYIDKDNKLHSSFSITFTVSGRVGSRSPNLQNQPKRGVLAKIIRKLFVADTINDKLMEADYKASELAWVAQISGDEKMTRIFKQGKDPHRIIGLSMSNMPEDYTFKTEKELKQLRQHTKPLSFGLIYLMMAKTLVPYAKQEYGVIYTEKEADQKYNKFFSDHWGIKKWHEVDKAFLNKYGYLRTIFGRKRNLPQIFSDDKWVRARAERTGINTMIQGPSSDMTLYAGWKFINDPRVDKNECKIVLFIHDALIMNCNAEKTDYYINILQEHMTNVPDTEFGFQMNVPLSVEAEIGDNLAEMEEVAI